MKLFKLLLPLLMVAGLLQAETTSEKKPYRGPALEELQDNLENQESIILEKCGPAPFDNLTAKTLTPECDQLMRAYVVLQLQSHLYVQSRLERRERLPFEYYKAEAEQKTRKTVDMLAGNERNSLR